MYTYSDKFDLDKLITSFKDSISYIGNVYQAYFSPCNLAQIEDVNKTLCDVRRYAETVSSKLTRLSAELKLYEAKRNAPKRAQALDDCDKILRKLDSIRDIICRSIEGDADVVCTETGAETISRWLEPTIERLPHLAETAYVVEGKR